MNNDEYQKDIDFLVTELSIVPEQEFDFWEELTITERAALLWIFYGREKAKGEEDYIRPVQFLKLAFFHDESELNKIFGERSYRSQFRILTLVYLTQLSLPGRLEAFARKKLTS